MSEAEFKQLEARVRSLEDWQQRCIQADIAAPTPQPKEDKKDFFRTDKLTVWQSFPETETNQGKWEKNIQFNEPQYQEIVRALEAAGKQLHSTEPNALYWLLTDLETDK